MGIKQGCPLNATLFELFMNDLEQHLMDTLGHDAPALSGALISLLLYADDLTIMSTTLAGLQHASWLALHTPMMPCSMVLHVCTRSL